MISWLEAAMLAEHEAPRKVLEPKPPWHRRAGRNYQLLLKVRPEAAARFAALADAQGLCFGEFFEKALDATSARRVSAGGRPATNREVVTAWRGRSRARRIGDGRVVGRRHAVSLPRGHTVGPGRDAGLDGPVGTRRNHAFNYGLTDG
jgi:hypothetical protein